MTDATADARKRLTIRLNEEQHRRIRVRAAFDQLTINDVVLAILMEACPALKAHPPVRKRPRTDALQAAE